MRIAIVGAECCGKSTLSSALQSALHSRYGAVTVVPEYLRAWCAAQGRTPSADEQAHIAATQAARIEHADTRCVVADTTPWVTAVYSDVLFNDSRLYGSALAFQRTMDITLLLALDLPWVADGIQRDGIAIQQRIDARLRTALQEHRIPFATVYGHGEQRLESALQAITHADQQHRKRLPTLATAWVWTCDSCSDPECEHRLFSRLTTPNLVGV